MNKILVVGAIIHHSDKFLIVQRSLDPTDLQPGLWEFPGGKVEDGESPEDCLKREMKEEFEIDVSVGESLGESVYHYRHGSIKLLAFRTYWDRGSISPKYHDDFRWVTLDEINSYDFAPADIPFVEKLRSGEIELRARS